MKSIYPAIAVALAVSTSAFAQSADELINDTATPGDVLTYGMGYGQQRFSQLDQINADNVGQLTPAWVYSLDDSRGQ